MKRLRLLLATPSDHHDRAEYLHSGRENLGIEYLLAAAREAGHDAFSVNENLPGDPSLTDVSVEEYDVIGFSLPFWEYRVRYVDLINKVAARTSACIVAGGHAGTIGARYFLARCPRLPCVILGDGEVSFIEFLEAIANDKSFDEVRGLCTRTRATKRDLGDVDKISLPHRDELARALAGEPTFREAYVTTTRGCMFSCSFCSIPTYYRIAHGPRWRERSVQSVAGEIDQLVAEFPTLDSISFTDDNFLGCNPSHHQRGIAIARHLYSRSPDLSFDLTCRTTSVNRSTFAELAQLGLSGVFLGIESGVQRILDSFKKRATVADSLRAIEVLAELRIGCDIGFIMFAPDFSLDDIEDNILFLERVLHEFPVYVHPAAIFRCLRQYPKDLGVSADDVDGADITLPRGPTGTLYRSLQYLWESRLEQEFTALECAAALGDRDQEALEDSRKITLRMIDFARQSIERLRSKSEMESSELVCTFSA